ncbi:MAG: metal ABC transporter permease [Candidatus Omnitrophota bacterium]|nr:metal ABC transporter permease [Candidatus Omnitrophota bacterium]MDZ4241979.1 metal ABC transporter permease [Candidatus Omnitrophota bacterium]
MAVSIEQFEIIVLASLTAVACALPGTFLVLRRVALMSDAISHAILLGIVLAFFVTKNLSSPFLVISAAGVGILTVSLTELLINTQKLKKDAAIGLVFPFLFSIGVILINLYTSDVHIDSDCVLFGEIAFAPFNRFVVAGKDLGVQGIWMMGGICLLNVLFISLFYKELKIATFDAGLAKTLGFRPNLIHYGLMLLVSITSVGSFESVGSILVVALMIAPPCAAYLLTDRLSRMLIFAAGIGVLSAVLGYLFAYILDASIAGSMATVSGILFLIVLIFAPEKGLLTRYVINRWQRLDFGTQTLAVHLLQAELSHSEDTELVVSHMNNHMLWNDEYTSQIIAQGIEQGLIRKEGNKLMLTPLGREKAKVSISKD